MYHESQALSLRTEPFSDVSSSLLMFNRRGSAPLTIFHIVTSLPQATNSPICRISLSILAHFRVLDDGTVSVVQEANLAAGTIDMAEGPSSPIAHPLASEVRLIVVH